MHSHSSADSTPSSNSSPPAVQGASTEQPADSLWRLQVCVLILLSVTVGISYLTRHCLAVANTRMQAELHFNNEQFGYLYAAFSIGYLIFQVPGGWAGQRWGTRTTITILCGLWSFMTLATSIASNLPLLILARFGVGLSQAGLIPNQAQVLKDWFRTDQRGTASATITTAMSVGGFASLSLTSWLLKRCHWRTLFLAYGIVGLLWAALFWLAFRSHPRRMSNRHADLAESPAHAFADAPARQTGRHSTWNLLSGISFWALFLQMVFKAAGYNFLVTFFPTWLELAWHVPADQTGWLASWSLVAILPGSMAGGWVIDRLQSRTGSKRISRAFVGATSLVLTGLMMLLACFATNGIQAAAIVAIAAAVVGIANPCLWAASIDLGEHDTAVVMGLLNMGGALAGLIVSPLIGRLLDTIQATQGNWNYVLLVHAVFYCLAAISWLFVRFPSHLPSAESPHAL